MGIGSLEQEPRVSVIIPAWNGAAYLPACLDALLVQEPADLEVIVVDNASTDGSAGLVATRYPDVHLIRHDSNLGFAGACNAGLRAARGNLLVLLNQDTVVRAGWLAALVQALEEGPAGIVGCKILYPDGKTVQHAGAWIEWPLGLAHHHGQGERDEGQWDAPRIVEGVTGAAMALRREVLDTIGLLDEAFWPGYFEDADLCYRAREAGFEIGYVPHAVLTHAETTSLDDVVTLSRAYHRGRLRFVLKHLSPPRFLDEFVPAERVLLRELGHGHVGNLLRVSYLEAIADAAVILPDRWRAEIDQVDRVLSALQGLLLAGRHTLVPPLQEFEFRSSVPVVGSLLARLRLLWYSVAARWAVRYLIQQQEAINQQQDVYLHALISMSRQLARLTAASRNHRPGGDKGGTDG